MLTHVATFLANWFLTRVFLRLYPNYSLEKKIHIYTTTLSRISRFYKPYYTLLENASTKCFQLVLPDAFWIEDFSKNTSKFSVIPTYLHYKKVWILTFTNLIPHYPIMCLANFSWNWSFGSWEENYGLTDIK